MKSYQKMFHEDLAQAYRDDPEPKYRPSNGCEGDSFMQRWCNRCTKSEGNYGGPMGCDISDMTMLNDIDAPDYPTEWTYEDGQPCCTAFEEREQP